MAAEAKYKFSARARSALKIYRAAMATAAEVAAFSAPLLKLCSRRVNQGVEHYRGELPGVATESVLWVHGVSMGESMVAIGFAAELRRRFPDYEIVFSTTHPDVKAAVEKKQLAAAVAYFPLDSRRFISEALGRWKPAAVFVAETDFWPEFSYQCRSRNIPLILINGRVSSKICSFYSRFRGLAELVFQSFTMFSVQSSIDAQRLKELGVEEAKIKITGNMKADLTAVAANAELGAVESWAGSRQLLVLGSLHPDEFSILLPVLSQLLEKVQALIIAPRNPQNAVLWQKSLRQNGFSADLRSELNAVSHSSILLLDTMGELAACYGLATIAFVGGSLDEKIGGHNPLEVVQQKVPLIMGPGYRNFNDIIEQLKSRDAIRIVASGDELVQSATDILSSENEADRMVKQSLKVLEDNRGAISRTIELVSPILESAV